ncbi:hypothetical protein ACI3L1_06575 [Deinococcus sp. SM5_A1]|uniref:hypothetical protein n=1 Tax=Deinococcus sp. SM5_A1 TaxID=3379094 RepID=UPI00385EFA1D
MNRADTLLILTVLLLALAGVVSSNLWSPALIVLGLMVGRVAWKLKDREELLRLFA